MTKSAIEKMVQWLDNRDRHSGKIRKAEMRYIRTKAHELAAEEKSKPAPVDAKPASLDLDSVVDWLSQYKCPPGRPNEKTPCTEDGDYCDKCWENYIEGPQCDLPSPAPVEDYVFIPVDLPDMTASGIVMLSDGTKTDWEDIELYAKVRRNR